MELKDRIKQLAKKYHSEVVSVRRYIHAHPELSFEERRTSGFVQEKLQELGISYKNGIAGTGVIAEIKGKNPDKRVVALRADMDALPITEKNDVSYKSRNDGVMHACGHDVHTSSLLGTCKVLHELRNEFEGTVRCLFQPGEERFPGGASIMIKEGALKNPEPKVILGQHVYSHLPVGTVGFRPGLFMASSDEIKIRISGVGGHGAVPHRAVDPIAIAAQVITGLQQVISRMCDPTVPSVLTFGAIHSDGGTFNVIPEAVDLHGTFRTFSEYWRFQAHKKIERVATNIAKGLNGKADVKITVGYPTLVNHAKLTKRCRKAAIEFLGKDHVMDIPLRLTSEDFAYYTHEIRGCFYRLGIANSKKGITSPVHSPTFDIDEDALETSVGLMTYLTLQELSN